MPRFNQYVPGGCRISHRAADALRADFPALHDAWAEGKSFSIPEGDGVYCLVGLQSPEALRPRRLMLVAEVKA